MNGRGAEHGPCLLLPVDREDVRASDFGLEGLVRGRYPAKHMELVAMLKSEHGMGHGHANALVAHMLGKEKG